MSTISLATGIYLHWPFCARKCPYCDFYTFGREHPSFDRSARYHRALIEEIESMPERFGLGEKPAADTIYFGGGTPSLLEPGQLEAILSALRTVFEIDAGAEITLEVNPTAAEAERLKPARELGVNRLSVGCQSFNDKFLRILGRDHDAATARRVVELIRGIGYDNISLDLMFGLPDQSLDDLESDLNAILSFNPEHVSAYGLTLHEGTPFKRWHQQGMLRLPEAETEAGQFGMIIGRFAAEGYEHYEISNWRRPGFTSRHNSKYWRQCEVYAFGVSAHGVIGGRRFSNPRDMEGYLGANGRDRLLAVAEPAPESIRSAAAEILMLAIRRVEGVDWTEINQWIAAWVRGWPEEDARLFFGPELRGLVRAGLIESDPDRLQLSRSGILLADTVAEAFF